MIDKASYIYICHLNTEYIKLIIFLLKHCFRNRNRLKRRNHFFIPPKIGFAEQKCF